jgi:adenosylmethionine-8-amino-7-oxononanoate aminotransferase
MVKSSHLASRDRAFEEPNRPACGRRTERRSPTGPRLPQRPRSLFSRAAPPIGDGICLLGLAVLDVIEEQDLTERAAEMGAKLTAGLRYLQQRHEIIGNVRGLGLLHGVELVRDRETREPDAATARAIANRCMELGLSMNIVAISTMAAIWRIAPPLTVSEEEIERGVATLDQAISDILAGRVANVAE